jgi:hypothetical protein
MYFNFSPYYLQSNFTVRVHELIKTLMLAERYEA